MDPKTILKQGAEEAQAVFCISTSGAYSCFSGFSNGDVPHPVGYKKGGESPGRSLLMCMVEWAPKRTTPLSTRLLFFRRGARTFAWHALTCPANMLNNTAY
jgi:hypothetical protein